MDEKSKWESSKIAKTEQPINLHDYFEIGLRRKWYIIVPFVLSILVSFGVYKHLPKIYQSTTLILVQPQSVPENYVRPTVTESVINRLNTISQEILSRTRLEKIIEEFNLYGDLRKKVPMEEVAEAMRKAIIVKVDVPIFGQRSRNDLAENTFSISYEGEEPRTVMMVTNKLASMIIEENLKVRELRAGGTSEFIVKELNAVESELKKKESDIRNFKERSMGQLPQQLDANLKILERLQQQLQTTSENMRATEDKIVLFQNQIEQLKRREPVSLTQGIRRSSASNPEDQIYERIPEDPLITQLNTLKRELTSAQSRYKETHPDVIDLKRKIAKLEPQVKELLEKQEADKMGRSTNRQGGVSEENLPPPMPDPNTERLLTQYTDQYNNAVLEAKRAREEIKNLKDQIILYQRRIEDTPRKEQELTLLTRDYDLLKANYQSLLDKKIQSQMAENLERKQQGEQFKILDPARLPEKPIKPDRNKILLIGAFMGFVLGLGLTWYRESLDQCFRTVKELEDDLGIPVVAMIPNLKEEKKAA
jgi:polysaccharide chain length determinant protein (PEP-CTERM system associated)